MNGNIFFTISSLLTISICRSAPVKIIEDELAVEVNERVNPEINFDEMLQKYNLTSFRQLLMQAKLFDTLNVTTTSYTVFAPTNQAIMNAKSLLQNSTHLPEILKYHVHKGAFPTDRVEPNMRLKTLLGGQQKIRFERYKGVLYGTCQPFSSVKDKTYDNGILDLMNGVMVPPEGNIYDILNGNASFESYLGYAKTAGIQRFLQNTSPMTLLLPNNDAFSKLTSDVKEKLNDNHKFLIEVLEYHFLESLTCLAGFETGSVRSYEGDSISVTVSGKKVLFNKNSTLILPDIIAYNGVVHVIDTVLLPPQYV